MLSFSIHFFEFRKKNNILGTKEQAKLLIGGEACLWAEYVDGTNIGKVEFLIKIKEFGKLFDPL
jgi:hypothetical protein